MKLGKKIILLLLGLTLISNISLAYAASSNSFHEESSINQATLASVEEEHFFENYKEDALQNYFAEQEIKVERPLWRKLDLINHDKEFFRTNYEHEFELNYDLEGLIFEISKVRDTDRFNIAIENEQNEKKIYHQLREILYTPAKEGKYNVTIDSNVFEQTGFKIYESDIAYPGSGILLLNDDDADYEGYNEKIEAFIGRGGVLINLGSERINKFMTSHGESIQELKLEGETQSIKYIGNYYFFVPRELFLKEELAVRVIGALKTQLGITNNEESNGISTLLGIVLVFVVFAGIYRNRNRITEWVSENLYPLMKKMAISGVAIAVFVIIVVPFLIYLYKNYSGLDLLPGITIDQLIDTYNLKLIAKLILALVAFIVIIFAVLIAWVEKPTISIWGWIKEKFLQIFRIHQTNKKDLLFVGLVLIVAIALFISVFTLNEEGQKTNFPEKIYNSFEGKTAEMPSSWFKTYGLGAPQIELRSDIPLVYNDDEFFEQNLKGTFPTNEQIEKVVTNQNPVEHKTVYADVKHLRFFGYFKEDVMGQIIIRNKNKEFSNKDMIVSLVNLNGDIKDTTYINGQNSLLGEEASYDAHPFTLKVESPGIYAIKIENSDPLKVGDYEIVSISANTNIFSLNEIVKDSKWHKEDLLMSYGEEFRVEPYQLEKVNERAFYIRGGRE